MNDFNNQRKITKAPMNSNYILTDYGKLGIPDLICHHICEKMDWITWTTLCVAKPQFRKYTQGKSEQTLILPRNIPLYTTLTQQFHLVKDLILEDSTIYSRNFFLDHNEFATMTSLQSLAITEVASDMAYITAKNIEKLTVIVPEFERDLPYMVDFTEILVNNNPHIKYFYYMNGNLSCDNMSKYLRKCPLEALHLYGTSIENKNSFTNFLNSAQHLCKLSFIEGATLGAQECFSMDTNMDTKKRILALEIELLWHLGEIDYLSLLKCTNLLNITIKYDSFERMEAFYDILLNLHTLTTIVLRPNIWRRNKVITAIEVNADKNNFHYFNPQFKSKGVNIILRDNDPDCDDHRNMFDELVAHANP